MGVRDYERVCQQCERWFTLKTLKAKFCCANCRVAHKRGHRSKWQKLRAIYEDKNLAQALGFVVTKVLPPNEENENANSSN